MIDLECMRAKTRIDRRSAGLSVADALRLEDHLSSCAECGRHAVLLDSLRSVAGSLDASLTPERRERAIASALRAGRALAAQERSRTPRYVAAFALVALAAVLLAWRGQRWDLERAHVPVSHEAIVAADTSQHDRVLAGQLDLETGVQGTGSALADGATLRSVQGATLALAHAHVELRPASVARWDAHAHALALLEGSVRVDVDPALHQRFVVSTPQLSVLVLGTRFEVSLASVSVERGRVRVFALDGQPLRELGAGERFELPAPSPPSLPLPLPLPANPQTATESARHSEARTPGADPSVLLTAARTQLAAKHIGEARRAIDQALLLGLAASDRAEALTLRAECALLGGEGAAAIAGYLRVARAFPQLPAGENASFSAARLQMEQGRRASAAKQLASYLERYPNGRFVAEARLRLRELSDTDNATP